MNEYFFCDAIVFNSTPARYRKMRYIIAVVSKFSALLN